MRTSLPTGLVAGLILLALTACNKPADHGASSPGQADPAAADAAASRSEAASPPALPLSQLAYSYEARLEVPSGKVRSLLDAHEQACYLAGPAVCQVLDASAANDDGVASASLKLRAQADWLNRFRGRLDSDAETAGGRQIGSGVGTDELSRALTDTEAQVKSQIVLRDRLRATLASRKGTLTELLQMETELARVQGEIDAARSELANMRGRVATAEMKVSYTSLQGVVSRKTASPLGDAVQGAATAFVWSLSALIMVAGLLAPFALIGGGFWWFRRRRRLARRAVTA